MTSAVPVWLPNAITAVRIALIPVFVLWANAANDTAAMGGDPGRERVYALTTLIVLAFSDVVDGFLARKFGLSTPLGALLDAVADKLAQMTLLVFFGFFPGPAFAPIPVWFVVLVFARDAVLAAGWLVVRSIRGKVDAEHEIHGKLASVCIFAILFAITADVIGDHVPLAIAVTATIVVASTLRYVYCGWAQTR